MPPIYTGLRIGKLVIFQLTMFEREDEPEREEAPEKVTLARFGFRLEDEFGDELDESEEDLCSTPVHPDRRLKSKPIDRAAALTRSRSS